MVAESALCLPFHEATGISWLTCAARESANTMLSTGAEPRLKKLILRKLGASFSTRAIQPAAQDSLQRKSHTIRAARWKHAWHELWESFSFNYYLGALHQFQDLVAHSHRTTRLRSATSIRAMNLHYTCSKICQHCARDLTLLRNGVLRRGQFTPSAAHRLPPTQALNIST